MKLPPLYHQQKPADRKNPALDFFDLYENPFGPSPLVKEELTRFLATDELTRYPSEDGGPLREALAAFFGLPAESFLTGNGSGELLYRILDGLLHEGDEAFSIIPAWDGYNHYCFTRKIRNTHVPFYVDGETLSVDFTALRDRVTSRTKVIYLVSPSLPGGVGIGKAEFLEFLRSIPETVAIIVDEAYYGLGERSDLLCTHELVAGVKQPLLGLRTFSKFFGLAGLRLGYAFGPVDTMTKLRDQSPPFAVNILSERAGIAVLKDTGYHDHIRKALREEKAWLKEELTASGFITRDSDYHFLNVDVSGRENEVLPAFDDLGLFLPRNLFLEKYLQFPVSTRGVNEKNLRLFLRARDTSAR